CGYIERIFTKKLLYPPAQHLWRITIHHAHSNSVLSNASSFPKNLYRIFVIFECCNESECIKGVIFKRHIMRICHHKIAFEKMNRLRKHQRRDVSSRCLNTDFFPPAGKTCGTAPEFQERLDTLVWRDKLLHYFFLPDFSSFIAPFIPLLVRI